MIKLLVRVLDRVCELLAVVTGLILVFITLSIGYSIFVRLVNIPGPIWVVQFNEYAMLFAPFLGTAWLLSRDKHISVQMLVQRLGKPARKILDLAHSLVGMGLCATLCWFGIFTTWEQFERKVIDVQAVDLPIAYILAVIPLGFFLLFLQFTRKFFVGLQDIKRR